MSPGEAANTHRPHGRPAVEQPAAGASCPPGRTARARRGPGRAPAASGPSPRAPGERVRAATQAQCTCFPLPETSASRLHALSQRKRIPAATSPPGGARPVPPKCGEPGGTEARCGGQAGGPAGAQVAFSGSPWAPPSDLGPARSQGSPRTLGPRPGRAGPARATANQVCASRWPSPTPSKGGRLRLDRHRARPSPPGLTARRSRRGAAARNMVSTPGLLRTVCLTAASRGLTRQRHPSITATLARRASSPLLPAHWAVAQPMGTAQS